MKLRTAVLQRKMHVVRDRPQEDGRSVRGQDQTLEVRVTLTFFQEDGKVLYTCQGLTCKKNQGRRYLDLVRVVFPSDDGREYKRRR